MRATYPLSASLAGGAAPFYAERVRSPERESGHSDSPGVEPARSTETPTRMSAVRRTAAAVLLLVLVLGAASLPGDPERAPTPAAQDTDPSVPKSIRRYPVPCVRSHPR